MLDESVSNSHCFVFVFVFMSVFVVVSVNALLVEWLRIVVAMAV